MLSRSDNPGYTDSKTLKRLAAITARLKKRTVEILRIGSGDRVIDVGCGPGIDTTSMAHIVGEKGLVIGIDYDESIVSEANRLADEAGVADWVRHLIADASSIPCQSNSFNVCRSERMFQHVTDSIKVMREMVRVTRTGGRVAVADTDWGTLSVDTSEVGIERRIAFFRGEMYNNGYAGRKLYRLLKQEQLKNVIVEIHPIIWTNYEEYFATSFSLNDFEQKLIQSECVSSEELQQFLSSLEASSRNSTFFASANLILASGTKT